MGCVDTAVSYYRLDCSLLGAIGLHYVRSMSLGLGLGSGLRLALGLGLVLGLALVFSET